MSAYVVARATSGVLAHALAAADRVRILQARGDAVALEACGPVSVVEQFVDGLDLDAVVEVSRSGPLWLPALGRRRRQRG